jgi:hypothetical protein
MAAQLKGADLCEVCPPLLHKVCSFTKSFGCAWRGSFLFPTDLMGIVVEVVQENWSTLPANGEKAAETADEKWEVVAVPVGDVPRRPPLAPPAPRDREWAGIDP